MVPAPLDEHGRLCGGRVWVEERCFELTGRWSASAPEPRLRARLGARSRHHAWRAGLWRELLPVVAGTDPEALVVPPDDDAAAAVADLGALAPGPEALARLDELLLRPLVASCEAQLAATGPATDGALERTLRRCLHDVGLDLGQVGAGVGTGSDDPS